MDLDVGCLVIHDLDGTRAAALAADLARDYGASRCRVANDLEGDIKAAAGVVERDTDRHEWLPGQRGTRFRTDGSALGCGTVL